jgi:hypothetical protein
MDPADISVSGRLVVIEERLDSGGESELDDRCRVRVFGQFRKLDADRPSQWRDRVTDRWGISAHC